MNVTTKEVSLEDLYSSSLQITQLPRGIVSNAELGTNVLVNSIVVFLNSPTRRTKRKSIELWGDYVAGKFILRRAVEPEGSRSKEVEEEEEFLDGADDTSYRVRSFRHLYQ